jgi:hypothetical protein
VPDYQSTLETPSLKWNREELKEKDRDVEADTPRDLEHGGLLGRLQAQLIEVPR